MELLTPEQLAEVQRLERLDQLRHRRATGESLTAAEVEELRQDDFDPIPPPQKPTRQRKSKAEAAGLTEERVREIVKETFEAMFVVSANGLEVRVSALEASGPAVNEMIRVGERLSRLESGFQRVDALERMGGAGLESRVGALESAHANLRNTEAARFNDIQRMRGDVSAITYSLEQRTTKLEVLAEKFSTTLVNAAMAKVFGGGQ